MKLKDFPLMDHQTEAITFMRGRMHSALFLEQGTGKTLTGIAYAETHPRIHKTLISCRKDNIKTWKDEVALWTPSEAVGIVGSTDKKMTMLKNRLVTRARA